MKVQSDILHAVVAVAIGLGVSACASRPRGADTRLANLGPDLPNIRVFDADAGDCRLVIRSFGSPPEKLGSGAIKGSGLEADLIGRSTGKITRFVWSEADGDVMIDFSEFSSGIVRFVEYTDDPRSPSEDVPLLRRTVKCRAGIPTETVTVLLTPEAGKDARVAELVKDAQRDINENSSRPEAYDVPMAHLRNIGLGQPGPVLAAFDRIVADGGAAESLAKYRNEVETAVSARQ